MKNVSVCIGSACHLKGSYSVISALQDLLEKHGLNDRVEVKAVFCLQQCGSGVSVKVDEGPVLSLSRERVDDFFRSEILEAFHGKG